MGRVEEASLGGFISKYMREKRKGEVMDIHPKKKDIEANERRSLKQKNIHSVITKQK